MISSIFLEDALDRLLGDDAFGIVAHDDVPARRGRDKRLQRIAAPAQLRPVAPLLPVREQAGLATQHDGAVEPAHRDQLGDVVVRGVLPCVVVELALDVMKEMNTVYYAYGTENELIENQVIMKEGGFIGIGRQTNIADDFNEKYFQKLDKTKIKEIKIIGKQPKLATVHPISSYEWKGDKLIIKDTDKFWRISNYLVVIVK